MTDTALIRTKNRTAYPVFRGLDELSVSDADLAKALEAQPAEVTAWRTGAARVPGRIATFLTLVLDALVERRGSELSYAGGLFAGTARTETENLVRARDSLQQQQAFNLALEFEDVREGLCLFNQWRRRNVFGRPMRDLSDRVYLRGLAHPEAVAH